MTHDQVYYHAESVFVARDVFRVVLKAVVLPQLSKGFKQLFSHSLQHWIVEYVLLFFLLPTATVNSTSAHLNCHLLGLQREQQQNHMNLGLG